MVNRVKPTALKLLQGSHRAYRDQELIPPVGEVGEAPESLSAAGRRCWDELVALALPDTLGASDRWLLEMTAALMARLRAGTASASDIGQLRNCLGDMGLTPSSKLRLTVAKPRKTTSRLAALKHA